MGNHSNRNKDVFSAPAFHLKQWASSRLFLIVPIITLQLTSILKYKLDLLYFRVDRKFNLLKSPSVNLLASCVNKGSHYLFKIDVNDTKGLSRLISKNQGLDVSIPWFPNYLWCLFQCYVIRLNTDTWQRTQQVRSHSLEISFYSPILSCFPPQLWAFWVFFGVVTGAFHCVADRTVWACCAFLLNMDVHYCVMQKVISVKMLVN